VENSRFHCFSYNSVLRSGFLGQLRGRLLRRLSREDQKPFKYLIFLFRIKNLLSHREKPFLHSFPSLIIAKNKFNLIAYCITELNAGIVYSWSLLRVWIKISALPCSFLFFFTLYFSYFFSFKNNVALGQNSTIKDDAKLRHCEMFRGGKVPKSFFFTKLHIFVVVSGTEPRR